MEYKICETIKELRKQREISQEVLAAALEITIQAVSKWETGNSLPDVLLLPRIAKFFGVSIDTLFFGLPSAKETPLGDLTGFPDDNTLRVVEFLGKKCLGANEWDKDKYISLNLEGVPNSFNLSVIGGANIKGDVHGYVDAGLYVNCGNVGMHVDAGHGVNCGNVGMHVDAGHGVNCGNVGMHVDAGQNVNCGNIAGGASSGGELHCSSINTQNGNIECGNLYCKGDIRCNSINAEGGVHHERDVYIK